VPYINSSRQIGKTFMLFYAHTCVASTGVSTFGSNVISARILSLKTLYYTAFKRYTFCCWYKKQFY